MTHARPLPARGWAPTPRPLIAVVVDPFRPARLEPFLRVLRTVADVRAWQPGLPAVDAVLATSPDAPLLAAARLDRPDVPVVVAETEEATTVLLVPGRAPLAVSPLAVDARDFRPLAPFVRARWRQRLDVPDDLPVSVGVAGAPDLDAAARRTALALAPAAVVADPHAAVEAAALGTAIVTDAATAAAIGADDARHLVVVADAAAPAARERCADLGRSWPEAARLGFAARLLVEERLDLSTVASALASALGSAPEPAGDPSLRLEAALADLDTPPYARIAVRARTAWAELAGPQAAAWEALAEVCS